MKREDLHEFHHITAFANLPSVLEVGILSHDRCAARRLVDISDAEIQGRRSQVVVPGGRRLHGYACLYVDARNAMLFRLVQEGRRDLAVLAVDTSVLDIEGVVVTDRNAASGVALFHDAASGVLALDADVVFATWWNSDRDAMQRRCAEVLVPYRVAPEHLIHVYVPSRRAEEQLRTAMPALNIDIRVNGPLFYGEDVP